MSVKEPEVEQVLSPHLSTQGDDCQEVCQVGRTSVCQVRRVFYRRQERLPHRVEKCGLEPLEPRREESWLNAEC